MASADRGWDWTRPDFQERLHEIYRELRDQRPRAKSPAGFWAVSRCEDVLAVASDPAFAFPRQSAPASDSTRPRPDPRLARPPGL